MKQNALDYVPIKRKLEERSPSKQFQQEFQASDDGSILFIKQIKTEKAFKNFDVTYHFNLDMSSSSRSSKYLFPFLRYKRRSLTNVVNCSLTLREVALNLFWI